jgi:hypothetical protein
VVFGIHGMGVSTPKAAVVAAATVGFDRDIHMPKGNMFTMGLLSIIVAAGVVAMTLLVGRTISVPGACPNEH